MKLNRFDNFSVNESAEPAQSLQEGTSKVEELKDAVTKMFMEYTATESEINDVLDWLGSSSTISFFGKLLRDKPKK